MRIEPKILDGNIERKSLYEKKQPQQEEPVVKSYEALFIDIEQITDRKSLLDLNVIDDEDRQAAFNARSIGKAFVPEMDTQEVKKASLQELAEIMAKDMIEVFGLDSALLDETKRDLEDKINNMF